jgi:hypothetical protein
MSARTRRLSRKPHASGARPSLAFPPPPCDDPGIKKSGEREKYFGAEKKIPKMPEAMFVEARILGAELAMLGYSQPRSAR